MKIDKKKILLTTVLYSIGVFASELTLGNPAFPINLWEYITIPAWKWSVPVHGTGLFLIILWNSIFKGKPIIFPILLSVMFFLLGETLNWFVFHFFKYSDFPFGPAGSFFIIIVLYIFLCTICSFLLRYSKE